VATPTMAFFWHFPPSLVSSPTSMSSSMVDLSLHRYLIIRGDKSTSDNPGNLLGRIAYIRLYQQMKNKLKTMGGTTDRFMNPYSKKLFELAEIAKMQPKERTHYEDSLKDYWDLKSSMETYFKEGKEEGRKEGRKEGIEEGLKEGKTEMAKIMLADGEPLEKIARYTGLSIAEIEALREKK